ncbi:hypothetical protein K435DRAFT_809035 [Dendrothele bispora CBS 962.96]|uniref:Uncharacterized protein n=1 Tax=Dendrothele bispora (strain CBS 962.96) TaxID=1314807 RepID=A0A4S8KZJ2_DENBC|nr:hypothetical protein K435DRAFT_809035 [Dendrothele bispora CBS 962.96]
MSPCDQTVPLSFTLPVVVTRSNSYIWPAELPLARGDFDRTTSNFFELYSAERACVHQMARVYTSNTARLDDDARHLTQDYPAFGENLSRSSSRSSTVSQASRSAYPGVPEEILERVSQAKTARLAARARYEAALANLDLPNSVVAKLENDLSKSEDELKFARIERTRAKFSNQHVTSPSKSPLSLPLLASSPVRSLPQPSLRPVPEDSALSLERGEGIREWAHRVNVPEDKSLTHYDYHQLGCPPSADADSLLKFVVAAGFKIVAVDEKVAVLLARLSRLHV